MAETSKRPLRVFLCHASEDKPIVRELYQRLKSEDGIDPWLDEKKLLPGQDFRTKIEDAVESSDAVIICLSNNSVNKDGFIQKELRYAKEIALEKTEDSIFLIPIRFEECDVPRGLRSYQWVNYFGEQKEESYLDLLKSLRFKQEQIFQGEEREAKLRVEHEKVERETKEKATRKKARDEAKIKAKRKKAEREAIEKKAELEKAKRAVAANKRKETWNRISLIFEKIVDFIQKHLGSILIILVSTVLLITIKLIQPFNPSSIFASFNPTPTFTPTLTTTPLSTSTKIQTSTPIILTPTLTFTPTITNTPTITSTPTAIPESIKDNKGVEMIFIPAGKFSMGLNADRSGTVDEDIKVDAFYIDKYEVTNRLYADCVKTGTCNPPHKVNSDTHPDYYGNPQFDNYPVINVDWHMAVTYCSWRDARLPTEAEWEKAARGTNGRIYPWQGSEANCNYANYYNCQRDTTKVGIYQWGKSPYDIYDMAGNVREWVSSLYWKYPYQSGDGREDPEAKSARVFRGGAWSSPSVDQIRTSYRSGADPASFFLSLGFRCARFAPITTNIPGAIIGMMKTTDPNDLLRCRLQPSLDSDVITLLSQSNLITIIGRLVDNSWLSVLDSKENSCWVSAEFIAIVSGSLEELPVNTEFPTSTATP